MNEETSNMHIIFNNVSVKSKIKGSWVQILDNVSGSIPKGKLVALLGESGSGKTTLLHVLCGITNNSSDFIVEGEILVDGKPREPLTWFKQFGLVRQEDKMDERQSVYECIEDAARFFSKSNDKKIIDPMCKKYLKLCNIEEIKDHTIKNISGGQKKRLSIARVLLTEPEILFLDEPFSGLDFINSTNLGNFFKHASTNLNTTFLFSVHMGPASIMQKCDKIIFLHKSELIFIGSNEELEEVYKNIGVKVPNGMSKIDHLASLTSTKYEYIESMDASNILQQFIELNKQNTLNIISGKNKTIPSKRLMFFMPSFSQIWTLMRRRFILTYLKGYKPILMEKIGLVVLFLSCAIFYSIRWHVRENININDSSNLQNSYNQILAENFFEDLYILTIFSILNSQFLGRLWDILLTELRIVSDELSLCKYNLVTYILCVIIYAYAYMLIVLVTVCLPLLFIYLENKDPLRSVLGYLLLISPVTLFCSLGMSLLFSLSKNFLTIKGLNQIAFIDFILELINLADPLHRSKGILGKINMFIYNFVPFVNLAMFSYEIITGGQYRGYSIHHSSIIFINVDSFKRKKMLELCDSENFYIVFSVVFGVLLLAGLFIQFWYRSPRFRL
ncbi:hypothetical protein EDEG_01116 [Edhazardia aedis USNM 41457]|uniref:ABC transporter domain-containing protein n=1 Tax=Edhazardia aedis (strain USNM 41457) TaxID=1003232 RepID=J9DQ59_EDHAE|nr:hypothetical protein EDEG_01116 [Edhazardia aedis USNM 41457]|eukprot:EJW04685.1 hypothetical protein EDEG_01116 [Edhazardia aedis USNM 41457]